MSSGPWNDNYEQHFSSQELERFWEEEEWERQMSKIDTVRTQIQFFANTHHLPCSFRFIKQGVAYEELCKNIINENLLLGYPTDPFVAGIQFNEYSPGLVEMTIYLEETSMHGIGNGIFVELANYLKNVKKLLVYVPI